MSDKRNLEECSQSWDKEVVAAFRKDMAALECFQRGKACLGMTSQPKSIQY
jgi:hypothetical protein